MASLRDLYVAGDAQFNGETVEISGELYIDSYSKVYPMEQVYPVGSIYLTTDSATTIPSAALKACGTWERASSTSSLGGLTVYVWKRTA